MELRDLQRLAPRALRHRGSRDQVSPGTYFYPAGTLSRHQGRDCLGMGWLLQGRGIISKGVCTPFQLLQALEAWPAAGMVLAGRCLQLAGKAKGGVFCWGVLLFLALFLLVGGSGVFGSCSPAWLCW